MRKSIYLFLALFLGLLAWIGTNQILIAGIFFGLVSLDGFFYLDKRFEHYGIRNQKRHECFQFINSFIIALSVKKTLGSAYQTVVSQSSGPIADELTSNQHLNTNEALETMMSYFVTPSYGLFLNVVRLYEEQGGDILIMGEFLIHEVRREEEKLTLTEIMVRQKMVNFIILWIMTLVILVFCRFGISSFYEQMLGNSLFIGMIILFMVFLMASFHVFFQMIFKKEKNLV